MTDNALIEYCYHLALKSVCVKAKFGSVIIKDGTILGEGYNGSPNPQTRDCEKLCAGALRKGVPSGTRLDLCYATHAEQWAILNAGKKSKGAVVYVAGFLADGTKAKKDFSLRLGNPRAGFYCSFCARIIWSAGCLGVIVDTVDGLRFQTLDQLWRTSYAVAEAGRPKDFDE